jgi:hypothetical protein
MHADGLDASSKGEAGCTAREWLGRVGHMVLVVALVCFGLLASYPWLL